MLYWGLYISIESNAEDSTSAFDATLKDVMFKNNKSFLETLQEI